MKILYAASKRKGAALQLKRILPLLHNHQIKVAAYHNSNYQNINWNLNALLPIGGKEKLPFTGEIIEIYYEQVKYFNPDLIISDLEPFTSHIGNALNIRTWQVSPLLLYYALEDKYHLEIYKNYSYFFRDADYTQRIKNMIFNSEKSFIYSHLGDLNLFNLKNNFEWIRPFHVSGKDSKTCEHELVAVDLEENLKTLLFVNQYSDSILFTNFSQNHYSKIKTKDINSLTEYACNIKNTKYLVNSGMTDLLGDAYYNNKFSWIIPDFNDQEMIINAILSEKAGLGKIIYDTSVKLNEEDVLQLPEIKYQDGITFLQDQINMLEKK